MRLARIALLGVGLATLACSVPRPVPPKQLTGWSSVRTPEFRLIGDAPPAELERLARELVLFEATFRQLSHLARDPSRAPVPVFAIQDRELARRYGIGGGAAGWMLPTLSGCFAVVGVRPNHTETRNILFHEYTHVLLRQNRRAPLAPWYDEGLSDYFSTLSIRDGAVLVGGVPGSRLAWLEKRGLFPLDRLFAAGISKLSWRQIHDFYATSWALSHYLLADPSRRRELASFVAQLEQGVAWPRAFAASFDLSPDQLERALEAHVDLLARGVAVEAMIDPGPAAARAATEPAPIASSEVAFELGRLALELGTEEESRRDAALARMLLESAVASDPSSPKAEAALGEARALDGDDIGAHQLEQQALGSAPGDAAIWLHAGRIELARAEDREARDPAFEPALRAAQEAYQRTLELDPSSAPAWFGLGRTAQRAGRGDDAVEAFEHSRRLGWSGSLDLELGTLYLERERRPEALALLWPIAQDPHGGPTSEKARERLEAAGLHPEETAAARH